MVFSTALGRLDVASYTFLKSRLWWGTLCLGRCSLFGFLLNQLTG